mmetsp:Transcript_23708/g.39775  ORF Transcript_23708/g.39775 Transcript_23708/m.39775 type:complete len:215 (+) Transcript_23708:181-825(+)
MVDLCDDLHLHTMRGRGDDFHGLFLSQGCNQGLHGAVNADARRHVLHQLVAELPQLRDPHHVQVKQGGPNHAGGDAHAGPKLHLGGVFGSGSSRVWHRPLHAWRPRRLPALSLDGRVAHSAWGFVRCGHLQLRGEEILPRGAAQLSSGSDFLFQPYWGSLRSGTAGVDGGDGAGGAAHTAEPGGVGPHARLRHHGLCQYRLRAAPHRTIRSDQH